ncbi:hypothetical protein [Confluentibacter lentus]|uniref:hypothetical protein n=1 Tax=Confluentibacter lentus TaxID=1699412 RepID=UPI0012FD8133|nr:hypothetical protein [Confluentibacter lentus]
MKRFYSIVMLSVLLSCSSTRMIDSWKSSEYNNYQPKKVLIVGITDNLTARKIFEQNLKDKLSGRGISAVESSIVFDEDFMNSKQTEEQIDKEVNRLVSDGYDSVLISAVKGVDNEISYSGNKFLSGYYWHHFGRYYYLYQDVYFEPGYYNNYKVYHIESSLYNIKTNNAKSLVWVASYNIIDPISINSTVHNYVNAIIRALKNESLIP